MSCFTNKMSLEYRSEPCCELIVKVLAADGASLEQIQVLG
jgi:hypothetical protein